MCVCPSFSALKRELFDGMSGSGMCCAKGLRNAGHRRCVNTGAFSFVLTSANKNTNLINKGNVEVLPTAKLAHTAEIELAQQNSKVTQLAVSGSLPHINDYKV